MAAILTGCALDDSDLYNPHTVDNQAEAGSTQVSVISVLRWRDYNSALAPGFKYSGTQALADAIPTTLEEQQSLLTGFLAKLAVATPGATTSNTTTTQGSTVQPSVTNFNNTSTTASGNVANVPADTNSIFNQAAPAGAFNGGPTKATLGVDPMLKYDAATALNQEVQLLNAEINSPLFSQMDAYIVRVQITTVPYARNEPYDTYCTLGLFPKDVSAVLPTADADKTAKKTAANDKAAAPANPAPGVSDKDTPILVPLLVSDDLEGSIEAKSAEQMEQFILGVYAMIHGVGVSGDFNAFRHQVESVMGDQLNSLLTVSSISPNTLTVRLGAMYQPGSKYAMVPRNHFITFLMLRNYPKNKADNAAAAAPGATPAGDKGKSDNGEPADDDSDNFVLGVHTTLRDATTGELLSGSSPSTDEMRKILSAAPFLQHLTREDVNALTGKLLIAIQNNRLYQFQEDLQLGRQWDAWDSSVPTSQPSTKTATPPEPEPPRTARDDKKLKPLQLDDITETNNWAPYLWTQVAALRLESGNTLAIARLPETHPVTAPDLNTAATLTDDSTSSTLVLDGFSDLFADQSLTAWLEITRNTGASIVGTINNNGSGTGTMNVKLTGSANVTGDLSVDKEADADGKVKVTDTVSVGGNKAGSLAGKLKVTGINAQVPYDVTENGAITNSYDSPAVPGTLSYSPAKKQFNFSSTEKTQTLRLYGESYAVQNNGKSLQVTFASLNNYIPSDNQGKINYGDIRVHVKFPDHPGSQVIELDPATGMPTAPRSFTNKDSYAVLYQLKSAPAPKPTFALTVGAQQLVVSSTGTGVLEFTLKRPDGSTTPVPSGTTVNVTVQGADVDTGTAPMVADLVNNTAPAPAATSTLTSGGITLTEDSVVTLHLINIFPGDRVTLNATETPPNPAALNSGNQPSKPTPITYTAINLPVVALPSASKSGSN